ncbi:MAG TPA: NAD(P)/FAD-dependent oxidoreductase, partial [Microcella sp.]|nr:NAD(P)/FAD-dependent oxidoreductase [Microcella sp.]
MADSPRDPNPEASPDPIDVAIVGGGANGLYLACLLAQRGIGVTVLERRGAIADRPRAFGIHPAALAALDAVGVGDEVRAQALVLEGGSFATSAGREVAVSFAPPARPGPVVLDQRIIERMLERRLADLTPSALRRGDAVATVTPHTDRVELALDAAGGAVVARCVVLADGVNGALAETLFGPLRPRGPSRWYAMAEADATPEDDGAPDSPDHHARLVAARDGIVESFPVPGARRRWVVWRASDAPVSVDDFRMLVRDRAHASVGRIHGSVAVFRAQSRGRRHIARGRLALVGDSAAAVSPIGGQGLALGWSAARVLADSIEQGLSVGSFRWAAYRRVVRRLFARARHRSAFFMRMGDPVAGRDLLRRGAAAVLGAPFCRPLARRLVVADAPLRDRPVGEDEAGCARGVQSRPVGKFIYGVPP